MDTLNKIATLYGPGKKALRLLMFLAFRVFCAPAFACWVVVAVLGGGQ